MLKLHLPVSQLLIVQILSILYFSQSTSLWAESKAFHASATLFLPASSALLALSRTPFTQFNSFWAALSFGVVISAAELRELLIIFSRVSYKALVNDPWTWIVAKYFTSAGKMFGRYNGHYSGIPLKRTPLGPKILSFVVRCPVTSWLVPPHKWSPGLLVLSQAVLPGKLACVTSSPPLQ